MAEIQKKELQKLLLPVSAALPCGEDLWLAESRSLLQQPMLHALQSGEEPKWGELCAAAKEQLAASRDLRVAVILSLALFRTERLPGLCDGLVIIHGLVDKFWDHVHPLPDGKDDPTRANVLSNLAAPVSSDSPYRFVKFLRELPLCRSAASGVNYSLVDIERAENRQPLADPQGKPAPTLDQIKAVFLAEKAQLAETRRLLGVIAEEVKEIAVLVNAKPGMANLLSFAALSETIQKILGQIVDPADTSAASLPGPPQGLNPGIPTVSGLAASAGSLPFVPGAIESREAASAALKAVSEYFKHSEPSSPIPFLLERARRLIGKDFLDTVKDLAPEDEKNFYSPLGVKKPE